MYEKTITLSNRNHPHRCVCEAVLPEPQRAKQRQPGDGSPQDLYLRGSVAWCIQVHCCCQSSHTDVHRAGRECALRSQAATFTEVLFFWGFSVDFHDIFIIFMVLCKAMEPLLSVILLQLLSLINHLIVFFYVACIISLQIWSLTFYEAAVNSEECWKHL